MDAGHITTLQAEEIMNEHVRLGTPTRDLLIERELMDEPGLLQVIAAQLGTQVVDLADREIDPLLLKAVPPSLARMYQIFPFEESAKMIVLATYDLLLSEIVDELTFVFGIQIVLVVASKDQVQGVISQHYPQGADSVQKILDEMAERLDEFDDD